MSAAPPPAEITVNDFVCAVGEMTNADALQRVKELVRMADRHALHICQQPGFDARVHRCLGCHPFTP